MKSSFNLIPQPNKMSTYNLWGILPNISHIGEVYKNVIDVFSIKSTKRTHAKTYTKFFYKTILDMNFSSQGYPHE